MVRRSNRNPRAEAVGDKSPSNGRNMLPKPEMESETTSSATVTESPDSESSDELTEPVAAFPPPVSRSPGVGMGLNADADPFPPPVTPDVDRRTPRKLTHSLISHSVHDLKRA